MCRGYAACDVCTKNCAIVHKKKNGTSSDVNRFFKVMHGKTYESVLYLPPKFARTVTDLVGQEARIEDVNGHESRVIFSNVDGSLALKEGWTDFYSDHHLEFGDLLVFNYMKKGHFIVQIYDASACERTKFSPRRSLRNKRPRLDQDKSVLVVDVNLMDRPSSSAQFMSGSKASKCQSQIIRKNVSDSDGDLGKSPFQLMPINLEDPICTGKRDDNFPEEDRSALDLSKFENPSNDTEIINCPLDDYSIDHVNGKPSEIDNSKTSMRDGVDKTLADNTGFIQDGDHILALRGESPYLSCSQVADQDNSIPNFSSGKQSSTIRDTIMESNSTGYPSIRSSQVPQQENALLPKSLASSILGPKPQLEVSSYKMNLSEKQDAAVMKELMGSRDEVHELHQISEEHLAKSRVVKVEPGLSDDSTHPSVPGSFSAAVKSKSHLVLPVCIPAPQRKRKTERVVYLENESGRCWPVWYRDLCYSRAFTDNWRSFCEANHVESGDTCEFEPQRHKSLIYYKVGVVRKSCLSSDLST